MKKFISAKRNKSEILGLVEFDDDGISKFARFPKNWSDTKVCQVFGLIKSDSKKEDKL